MGLRRWLCWVGRCIKIDEVSIRVAEVNRTGAPGLRGWRLDPDFHEALQSAKFAIDVGDFEFQDHTLVVRGFGRAGDVILLRFRGENREHACAGGELGIIVTRHFGFQGEDRLVKID